MKDEALILNLSQRKADLNSELAKNGLAALTQDEEMQWRMDLIRVSMERRRAIIRAAIERGVHGMDAPESN